MPDKPIINRYEQLIAWQSADALADLVDSMTSTGPALRDFDLSRQIRRSAAKAPAQIAEGFVRYKPKESAYYYRIARASLAETENHLRCGRRRKHWSDEQFSKAWELCQTALKTTTGLLLSRLDAIAQEEALKRKAARKSQPPEAKRSSKPNPKATGPEP
jgi:four helix bundle protein